MARKKGEGSWGKCVIKGITYQRFAKQYAGESNRRSFYGKSIAEVKQKVKVFEDKLQNQVQINSPKITFGEYILAWFEKDKYGNIKQRTYENYENLLNDYVMNFQKYDLANKQLKQLNGDIFQKHIDALSERLARSTIVKVYVIISQCLKYAYRQKQISTAFWEEYKIPTEENILVKKKEPIWLTKDDMNRLLVEAKRVNADSGRRAGKSGEYAYGSNALVIMLLISTGMRIGEAQALTWDDVNFDKSRLHITKTLSKVKNEKYVQGSITERKYKEVITSTKTKKSNRLIPMSDIAMWALNELKNKQELCGMFSSDGIVCLNKNNVRIQERNLRTTLNAMLIAGKCSHEKCSLHALRHSFGSILLRDKVEIAVISQLLGHADISTTYNVYIHILEEQKIEALQSFNFITPTLQKSN